MGIDATAGILLGVLEFCLLTTGRDRFDGAPEWLVALAGWLFFMALVIVISRALLPTPPSDQVS
ncbi:MAG TPA: hypothetical protein VEG66_02465 [Thermoplasmata archaeon]|nr:hypothetical protein [Thermoplasmata archaeon]